MTTGFYFFGKLLQILGMATVFFAFLMFFYHPAMGEIFSLTALGLLEFYGGYFIVKKTGVKKE